jgi:hypothetical protein
MPVPLIRTSERGDYKHCPFYWWHHWQNGLTTRTAPTWSWFGTATHKALEVRYPVGTKRGGIADVLSAFDEALGDETRRIWSEGGELDDEEVHDARLLGHEMLKGYVEHYGLDKHWQVLHTEQPFQIDVRHPVTGRLIAVYCGTWDLFVWDSVDKVYRLVDHKTRKAFVQNWLFYDLNDQGGSYLWVAPEVLRHMGLLGRRDTIDGIIFNILRKAMPQEAAEDGIVYNKPKKQHYIDALKAQGWDTDATGKPFEKLSLPKLLSIATSAGLDVKGDPRAKQPAPYYHRHMSRRTDAERVKQGLKVIDEARHMDLVRRGKLPLLKNTGEHCIRCPLFDFCLLDEQDPAEAQEYAATMLVRQDPYADHRAAMESTGYHVTREKRG